MQEKFYTVKEIAEILRISIPTAYRWLYSGRIPYIAFPPTYEGGKSRYVIPRKEFYKKLKIKQHES